MPAILVQDPETGEQRSVDEAIVRQNPDAYTLVEDQTLGVRAGDVGGLRQQEVTPETVRAQTFERAQPGELSEAARESVAEERHGGVLEGIKAGAGAALESATFGLSALATRPTTAIGREEAREAADVQSTARTIGGIAGAVVPGLLSGGSGAVATLARLTPAGRMTAATMRLASRGGVAKAAGAAGLEGFAGAAGDYIARTSLDENPDFSASAIVSEGLKGGALGLALGGAGELFGRAAGKISGKLLPEGRVGKLLDDVPIAATPPTPARSLVSGAKKAPERWTSYKRLVHRKLADDSADALRSMGTRIDDAANRGFAGELDDLVSNPAFIESADDATRALVEEAKKTAGELGESTTITKEWFEQYSAAVDLPNATKRLTKRASDDIEEMGAATIAETDELATRFDRLMDELHARSGIPSTRVPAAADAAASKLGDDVVAEGTRRGFLGRAGETATQVGGAAELASAVGLDVPTPTSLLGPLAGAYFKYKGLRAAGRKVGLIPASKATRAAQNTVSMGERISDKAKLLAGGLLKGISRSPAVRIAPTQIATRIGAINALDPATVGANAAVELEGTTAAVQASASQTAARAVQYLQETAPKDPIPNRPTWMSTWTPSAQASLDFSRRLRSVESPDDAIDTLLASSSYSIELEALNAVYPPLVEQLRNDLLDNSEDLVKNLDAGALARISRALSLPLTIETAVPSYGSIPVELLAPEPQPQFTQPSTPGASPSVKLEATERRAPR